MASKAETVNIALKKTGKRKTIKELEALLEEYKRDEKANFDLAIKHQERARELEKELEELRKTAREKLDDLKVRLSAAESSNQEMRGYLKRVHEDDRVREELIATGEPGGEQHLVPKRKPAEFPRPSDFSAPKPKHGGDGVHEYYGHHPSERRPPRHWIVY